MTVVYDDRCKNICPMEVVVYYLYNPRTSSGQKVDFVYRWYNKRLYFGNIDGGMVQLDRAGTTNRRISKAMV